MATLLQSSEPCRLYLGRPSFHGDRRLACPCVRACVPARLSITALSSIICHISINQPPASVRPPCAHPLTHPPPRNHCSDFARSLSAPSPVRLSSHLSFFCSSLVPTNWPLLLQVVLLSSSARIRKRKQLFQTCTVVKLCRWVLFKNLKTTLIFDLYWRTFF